MLEEAFEKVKDQMGPCGIACALCRLGNGTVAETALRLQEHINFYQIPYWAPTTPGGAELDFDHLRKALDWMHTYARCLGCEQGGGPPECAIRTCAKEKGFTLCSDCPDLEGCSKFDWLGESAGILRENLKKSRGRSKQELVEEAIGKMKK